MGATVCIVIISPQTTETSINRDLKQAERQRDHDGYYRLLRDE